MCNYCNFVEEREEFDDIVDVRKYNGDNFEFIEDIGAIRENLKVYIFDDVENDCKSLFLNSDYLDVRIEINYCPICGRKL